MASLVGTILSPPHETAFAVDAVALLAGGRGERLRRALDLIDADVAPVLIINVGDRQSGRYHHIRALGRDPNAKFEVVCVTADPDTTAGEARAMSALANERGWSSLAVVTSDYHLFRATIRFEQCFDGRVVPVKAESKSSLIMVLHEVLGSIEALVLDRNCRR